MAQRKETAAAAVSREGVMLIGEAPLFAEGSPGAEKFRLKKGGAVCDVVMKGGVTSGLVYPYAVLRLAQKFRLAGIGGTSAGAMAAALAAAAEYARTARRDHLAFSRFEARCKDLPTLLPSLFQPHDQHRSAFALVMAALEAFDGNIKPGPRRRAVARMFFSRAGLITWPILLAMPAAGAFAALRYVYFYGPSQGFVAAGFGLISGLLLLVAFTLALRLVTQIPVFAYLALVAVAAGVAVTADIGHWLSVALPAALGGAAGLVGALAFFGNRIVGALRETDFGFCSGMRRPGCPHAGVTDWLHESIQSVAGRGADDAPLTFGEVEAAVGETEGPRLALRMITTNMTLRRPYALPEIAGARGPVGWVPDEWRELFPERVVQFLKDAAPAHLPDDRARPLPRGADLPILVGARMSLSFPILFSAVPVYELSASGKTKKDRMLLVDGGLSSNMPLHFFDSLGPPAHPTFAFNLDDDIRLAPRPKPPLRRRWRAIRNMLGRRDLSFRERRGEFWRLLMGRPLRPPVKPPEAKRISLHRPGRSLPSLAPFPTRNVLGYLSGLLGAAKDWQDNLLSIMPGQFDRIVRIRLAPGEGGLNLVMPESRSKLLMRLGYRAGAELAIGFDLDAHRVRRALAAYQEIEHVAEVFGRNWNAAGLARALDRARPPRDSASAWTAQSKGIIIERFNLLAEWAGTLTPRVRNPLFPRPRGSLRITPNLSGDVLD